MELSLLFNFLFENNKDIIAIITIVVTTAWNYYLWHIYRSNRSKINLSLSYNIIKETSKGRVIEVIAGLENKSNIREKFSSINLSILGANSIYKRFKESEILFNKKIVKEINLIGEDWEWTWVNGECKNFYKTAIFIPKEYIGIKIICKANYFKSRDDYFLADSLFCFF